MYLYNVGYGSYEESEYWQFSHDEKFSEEELFDVVESCLYECLKCEIRRKKDLDEKLKEKCGKGLDTDILNAHPTIQALFCVTGNNQYLFISEMEKIGFKKIAYEQNLSFFGWASSLDKDGWKSEKDNATQKMIIKLTNRYKDID